MGWKTGANSPLGVPDIDPTVIDDTERVAVGTIVTGFDDTQGYGEFIYLPGVASCLEGSIVVYDLKPGAEATVLADADVHLNAGRPVAFAMAAIVADKFGWFQITGVAVADVAAAFAAGSNVFLTATGGVVDDAAVAGCQVLGAFGSSAIDTPSTGLAYVTINRPFVQGQIT